MKARIHGIGLIQAGERTIRWFLIPSHLSTNFEIQKYYEIEPNFYVFIPEIIYPK